jgi:long-chain acyl-CoA synthetase
MKKYDFHESSSELMYDLFLKNETVIYDAVNSNSYSLATFINLAFQKVKFLSITSSHRKVILSVDNSFHSYVVFFSLILFANEVILVNPKYSNGFKIDLYKRINADLFISESTLDSKDVNELVILRLDFEDEIVEKKILRKDFQNFDTVRITTLSSGTTDQAKEIRHPMINFINSSISLGKKLNLNKLDKITGFFPITYMAGILNQFFVPIFNGTSVMINEDSRSLILNTDSFLEKNKITYLWLNSTLLNIVSTVYRKTTKSFNTIIINATSSLNEIDWRNFEKLTSLRILNSYGLSETMFVSISEYDNQDYNSVGNVLDGVEIKIKKGIIYVRSIWNMPEATRHLTYDGFINTGDNGNLVDDRLYVMGREKEIIIRAGLNISPRVIENKIKENFVVQEIVVLGLNDEIVGEKMFLAYTSTEKYDLSDFNKYITGTLGQLFILDGVKKYDTIPKNLNSKFDLNRIGNDIKNDFT